MSDIFKAFVATVLVILVLVMHPLMLNTDEANEATKAAAKYAVDEFTSTAQSKGYIAPAEYIALENRLTSLGSFKVEIKYDKRSYQPVYTDESNPATFTGKYDIFFEGYYTTDILDVLFPTTSLPMDSTDRRWNMKKGDKFYVSLEPGKGTFSNMFRKALGFGQLPNFQHKAGGLVLNEGP